MKGRDSSTGLHDLFKSQYHLLGAPQVTQWVKNLLAMQEMQVDASSVPGSGICPGGGHGNTLQYSCLENLMDREAWQATARGVAKTQTQLKRPSTHLFI